MSTNVTPEYRKAEERYRQARTREEKISCLGEMLAKVPKHKGTEKLQAQIKTRLSKLRTSEGKSGGGKRQHITVPKEGGAQISLLGAPNAGKSQLLACLTAAEPEVAGYPFTTRVPQPGMMMHENAQLQLVDMPPISDDHQEGWMSSVLRTADAAVLVANLGSDDLLDSLDMVLRVLEGMKIFLVRDLAALPQDAPPAQHHMPTYLVGMQADRPGAEDRAEILREFYGDNFLIECLSREDEEGLKAFPTTIFNFLDLIRVYTQPRGGKPDFTRPFMLRRGSTVVDVAEIVHKDFAENLKHARLWGSGQFDGQKVQRDYVLVDQDILEFSV